LHALAGLVGPGITVILVGRGGVKPSRNRQRDKDHERHAQCPALMIRSSKISRARTESKKICHISAGRAALELFGATVAPESGH
jgi:hypothetical protein